MYVCVLQAKVHADLSMGNLAPQSAPAQLQNLPEAVSYIHSAAAGRNTKQVAEEGIARLLASLCHPDMSCRAVAADITSIAWLKAAAARPLPPCPDTGLLV